MDTPIHSDLQTGAHISFTFSPLWVYRLCVPNTFQPSILFYFHPMHIVGLSVIHGRVGGVGGWRGGEGVIGQNVMKISTLLAA